MATKAFQTPSPTLVVGNLETKTKKPELRKQLYALFTPYGRIIDIVAKKHGGGRGLAFIAFEEQAAATAAYRALQDEKFYGRSLRISYSKTESNAIVARNNPGMSKEAAALEAARMVVSRAQDEYEALERDREAAENDMKRKAGEGDEPPAKRVKGEDEDDMEIEMEDDDDVNGASSSSSVVCSNLPAECNEDIMGALFSQYPGFSKATQLSPSAPLPEAHPKTNAGAKNFRVTFASREQAEAAVKPLTGYLMQPGWEMTVTLE